MELYVKLCRRCIHSCKQRADLGLKLIKCPTFELEIQPLANNKADSRQGVGGVMKTKGK